MYSRFEMVVLLYDEWDFVYNYLLKYIYLNNKFYCFVGVENIT